VRTGFYPQKSTGSSNKKEKAPKKKKSHDLQNRADKPKLASRPKNGNATNASEQCSANSQILVGKTRS
jgi:hypothetical protein